MPSAGRTQVSTGAVTEASLLVPAGVAVTAPSAVATLTGWPGEPGVGAGESGGEALGAGEGGAVTAAGVDGGEGSSVGVGPQAARTAPIKAHATTKGTFLLIVQSPVARLGLWAISNQADSSQLTASWRVEKNRNWSPLFASRTNAWKCEE